MSDADRLVREDARLVVIDMQRVFADPSSEWATPGFERAVAEVLRLADGFRGRTIFTRFVPETPPVGSWIDYYEEWPFALARRDTEIFDLVPELAAIAGPTLDRPTFSKWGPQLRQRLGDAAQIVLAGVSTDCCVIATALAAADAGMHVLVAADACSGLTPADHDRALAAMALFTPHIAVASVDEILAAVSQTV